MNKNKFSFPRFDALRRVVDIAQQQDPFEVGRYATHGEAYDAIQALFHNVAEPEDVSSTPLNEQIGDELGATAKECGLAHRVRGDPLEPYFAVAHVLHDAMRLRGNVPVVQADDKRWTDASRIALAFVSRCDANRYARRTIAPQEATFADAVNFFVRRGINISLAGEEVVVPSADAWARVANTVWFPVKSLGDVGAMQLVDEMLTRRYDPVLGRVRMHPTPDLMDRKTERSLPCGHLYRLAIRTLGRPRTTTFPPRGVTEKVYAAATHLAGLYDVEPFSPYQSMFPPYSHRIFELLIEIGRYDELFSVPQCRPDTMSSLLLDLFRDFPYDRAPSGWSVHDAIILWRLLLGFAKENASTTFVTADNVRSALRAQVGRDTAEKLLEAFVVKRPNSTYQMPGDAHSAETRECAVVQASMNRLWLAPRPFLGPAFMSRLLSKVSDFDRDASQRIGKSFENRMFERMQELGVRCRRGDLGEKDEARTGDADLIIETDEIIALCELKKKALTRRTNSGNNLYLAADLALGLVNGVNQLARQEIQLRGKGALLFTDGSRLELNGRRIVKVVVSLADYGGFHDGATVRHTLRAMQGATLTPAVTVSEDEIALIEKLNAILRTLGQRHAEFAALVNIEEEGDLYDGLAFHNVFFVEELLLRERTAEKFLNALLVGMRMVTGTRDPFFDYAQYQG